MDQIGRQPRLIDDDDAPPAGSLDRPQVDVADPSHPRVVARMSADGRLVTARGTGRTVRVVLASTATRVPLTKVAAGSSSRRPTEPSA